MNAQQTEKVLELAKLNNSVKDIALKIRVSEKDVSDVLTANQTNTLVGLKSNITKALKKIQSKKTKDKRQQTVDDVNILINSLYDNFKWIVDKFNSECFKYYHQNIFMDDINNPAENIERILVDIRSRTPLIEIEKKQNLHPNEIMKSIAHRNKVNKSTVSKKLNKMVSETKESNRENIRLDIEDLMDELHMIYRWVMRDYEDCMGI